MNERSSRSHTIFTLNIESRLKASEEEDGVVKVAALVSVLIYRVANQDLLQGVRDVFPPSCSP